MKRAFTFFLSTLFLLQISKGQDVMMQGWYWDYPSSVSGVKHISLLDQKAQALSDAGFTYIWLPPLSESSVGVTSTGYDVKDYYNLGQYSSARWGIRPQLDNLINTFDNVGIEAVADMIYNHRDGGTFEDNPAVTDYIRNFSGGCPFPSDRFQGFLPLLPMGAPTEGDYYIKMKSATESANYFGKRYYLIVWTNKIGPDYGAAPTIESATGNGGGGCGEASDPLFLGKRKLVYIDDASVSCKIDEFKLTLTSSDFNPAGDTLWFKMYNVNNANGAADLGDMSDHHPYEIYHNGSDIANQLTYQTATNFNNLLSGRGGMNWQDFRPNGIEGTNLCGDEDAMLFYYDVEQENNNTRDSLFEWTKWMWQDAGIRGYRIDAVKHFSGSFFGDMMDYLYDNGIAPGMVVGESYDFDAATLNGRLTNITNNMDADTKGAIDVRMFDFSLRNSLENACDNGNYDTRNVFQSSMVDAAGTSPFNVVSFVNNHDFRDPGMPVDNEPILAYAYILTNNQVGLPCVFYTDYYAPNNLEAEINGLLEAHNRYIFGASDRDYLNNWSSAYPSNFIAGLANKSLIYQIRNGVSGKDVVVAINFSQGPLRVDQTLNMSNLAVGDTLTDILSTSAAPFTLVNSSNQIYMELPPRSYGVWVQGDLQDEVILTAQEEVVSTVQSLDIFPNPFSEKLSIDITMEAPGMWTISLLDVLGRELYAIKKELSVGSQSMELSLPAFPQGLYFINLQSNKESVTRKLMKE